MAKENYPDSGVAASDIADREIIISRLINAPQALVYEVWTDPAHIEKWWGPNGFTTKVHEMNVKKGGIWRSTMEGFGMSFPNRVDYLEVVKPERLVYTLGSGEPGDKEAFHVTVTFSKQGDKTLLTMRSLFNTAAQRERVIKEFKAIEGGNQTLDRFEQQLAEISTAREQVFTREFNAPLELVFKAWTEPERLAQWWGPKGFKLDVARMELRPGGMFLYRMSSPEGFEMWGKFVFEQIDAPGRLAFINSFSDKDGNTTRAPFSADWPLEIYNILTLTESAGKTMLTLRGWPIDVNETELRTFNAGRSSMQQGFAGTFEQLDAYLAANNK